MVARESGVGSIGVSVCVAVVDASGARLHIQPDQTDILCTAYKVLLTVDMEAVLILPWFFKLTALSASLGI